MIVLVPAVALLLLAGLARRPTSPAEPCGFEDLRPELSGLSDEANLLVLLAEADELLPPHARTSDWLRVRQDIARGEWETNRVAQILRDSEAARSHFWNGLPRCRGSASDPDAKYGSGRGTRIIGGTLGSAWALEFADVLRSGNRALCNGRVTALLRACETMLRDEGFDDLSVAYLLVVAMWRCEELLQSGGCPDAWLAEWAERLPQPEALRTAGVHTLKTQFWHELGQIRDGSMRDQVFWRSRGGFPKSADDLVEAIQRRTYSPGYAQRLLAASFREALAAALADRMPVGFLERGEEHVHEGLLSALRPNAGTAVLISCMGDGTSEVRWLKRLEARVAGLRVIIACERHRRQFGAYPETLQKLVPVYLKPVPLDPYSGVPLRYSRQREVVWASGEDLKDDGGSVAREAGGDGIYRSERPQYARDLVFPVSSNAFEQAAERARAFMTR